MKTSWYFDQRVRQRRPEIRPEWIKKTLNQPFHKEQQPDGRWRYYGYIEECGKYLRVVMDGDIVHNAFLDRNYTRKRK
jgi:hypothetical protein